MVAMLHSDSAALLAQLQEEIRPAEFSDDTLALHFTATHIDDLRYVDKWGHWKVWSGKRWANDKTMAVFDQVREICREQAHRCNDPRVKAQLSSAKTVAAVHRLAQMDQRTAAVIEQWDADPWLLNTPAGVIDLRTGDSREAKPTDYMTKMTAVAPGGECQRFLAFLHDITDGNKELQAFIRRMLGYCLTGVTTEHALFFCYGTGANGKGTLLNTIAGILGDYHRTAPIETFTASNHERHPTDLAGLVGARLVTVSETEKGRRWAESRIKQLTGGDPISARFMRQDFFDYVPQFKLIVSGNHKPTLSTVDEAIRRRFNLVPFTVTVAREKRDLELPEKLKEEWPGILQWIVDGCVAWRECGLQPPAAVTAATADYLDSQDLVTQWIAECCVTEKTADAASAKLFASWKEWAEAANERPGTQKALSELLENKFQKKHTMKGKVFYGVRLKVPGDI
jgi:putative DNA primase/helicase